MLTTTQAQTPQQRQANARFAKAQEKKMGKPEQAIKKSFGPQKSPIGKIWISTYPSTVFRHDIESVARGNMDTDGERFDGQRGNRD
jgi:hypothetical protein